VSHAVNEQSERTVDGVRELGEGQENHDLHPEEGWIPEDSGNDD
jgi:hypothetical protein